MLGYHNVEKIRWKKDSKSVMQSYCISNRKACIDYDEEAHSCNQCRENWLMDLVEDEISGAKHCSINVPYVTTMAIIGILIVLGLIWYIFLRKGPKENQPQYFLKRSS